MLTVSELSQLLHVGLRARGITEDELPAALSAADVQVTETVLNAMFSGRLREQTADQDTAVAVAAFLDIPESATRGSLAVSSRGSRPVVDTAFPDRGTSPLGAWLQQAMVERGITSSRKMSALTQGVDGTDAAVSAVTISQITRGIRPNISERTLLRLAAGLGVDPSVIRNVTDEARGAGQPYVAPDSARHLTPHARRVVNDLINLLAGSPDPGEDYPDDIGQGVDGIEIPDGVDESGHAAMADRPDRRRS